MAEYTQYIVKEGDRWDTIAREAYGDPLAMYNGRSFTNFVMEQNQEIPLDMPLVPGTILRLEVVEVAETNDELLPPWKRAE
jgi:hypothetical protein